MSTTTHTITSPSTSAVAVADTKISDLHDRVSQLADEARTDLTLSRIARATDPRTARELRRTWRRSA